MKRDAGRLAGLLAALAPALLFAIYLLRESEFVFLDDATTLAKSHWPLLSFAQSTGGGRYLPAFWVYNWIVFHLLPREPWALAGANGACLLVACGVWYLLLDRMGLRFAGVMTAWLTALNAAAAAVYFHLSTPETLLTACWAAAFALLMSAWVPLHEASRDKGRLWLSALVAAAAATMLAKETGALLAVPVLLWLGDLALRRDARKNAPQWVAALTVLLLAAALVFRHVRYGLGAGSYAANRVYAEAAEPGALPVFFQRTWLIPLTLLAALAAGGALSFSSTGDRRRVFLAMTAQLAALCAFLALGRRLPTYYFQPLIPFAGALLFSALAAAGRRIGRPVAAALSLLPVALHGWQAILVISALSAWNWQCGNLTRLVRRERPQRVWFFRTGYWEYQMQATMLWQARFGLPTAAGRLEWPGDKPDGLSPPGIPPSALQPGDWIVAGWQAPSNRDFPAGNLAWGMVGDGRDDPAEWQALELEKIADWRGQFPAFSELPQRNGDAHIIWKVYRVRRPPPG